jgi:aminomethyltransferase
VSDQQDLKRTPLHELHLELGGKMVAFAGYVLPVNYPAGILAEHTHTRTQAGLFDVSHMGQGRLAGEDAAAALETLVPGDIQALASGRMRYTVLTNEQGGILDDLMVTRADDHLSVVVNAATKDTDFAHMQAALAARCSVESLGERTLLALQGPAAATVLARHAPKAAELPFMSAAPATLAGVECVVSRSGYTGEDGFEISLAVEDGERLARTLLAEEEVAPIGLGARDTLRLEAGLCLSGHDIDATTTPVEAGLAFAIGKRRRSEGGFPGADIVLAQLANGPARKRVGILPEGRVPAREHTAIVNGDGTEIGTVTSGGFAPSLGRPVAMGYVNSACAAPETEVGLVVRGTVRPAQIAEMPFVRKRYHKD